MSRLRRNLPYINVVLNALILVSIALAYWTLKADHERRRKETTIKLYDTWRDVFDTKEGRTAAIWFKTHQISEGDVRKLLSGETINGVTKEQAENLRYQAFKMLNFLEEVAVCYRDDVSQSKMVDNYFGQSVAVYWSHLKSFAAVERDINSRAWVDLQDVIDKSWAVKASQPTPKGP